MAYIGRVLREQSKKHGTRNAYLALREKIQSKDVDIRRHLSIKEMAIAFMGDNWQEHLRNHAHYSSNRSETESALSLREATEAVDASGFTAITGQLLIDTVREWYTLADKVMDQAFRTVPITNGNLQSQIEPWLGRVAHDPSPVNQAEPYPHTRFTGQYNTYPAPEKYGEICNVAMEAIMSDLTGQILDAAASVGEMTALWEEYKKLAVFLGLVNNFSWNGTTYNTYLTSGSWVNKKTDFTLTDYESINTILQSFVGLTDPVTGKPIVVQPKDIFVMPAKDFTAKRILNATEVRYGNQATSGGLVAVSPNPVKGMFSPVSSIHARAIAVSGGGGVAAGSYTSAQADTITIAGDFKRAFRWREVYPLKVTQAPPQNPAEFDQDIILRVKSSVYGVACVTDPRYVWFGYNSSA